jgi:hypothetical protein
MVWHIRQKQKINRADIKTGLERIFLIVKTQKEY